MKINYVTAALALLLMAGCSNDVKESDIKFAGESGAKVSFSAVINNQEASELVTRATETSWEMGDLVGIGLSAYHYSNHLQDVIRFCGEVFRVDGRGQKTLFGRKCPELLWIHGSPRTSLHQEHVRMIEKTSLS